MIAFVRSALLAALILLPLGCGDDGGGGDGLGPLPTDPRPGKRSDVATVADPATGTIVLFGGDNGPIVNQTPSPAYIGDTWVLDPSSGWTQIAGAGPSARGRYAAAYDPAGKMWIVGGRSRAASSGPYDLYGDVWTFDYTARQWTEVSDGSGGPAPRYFATAAYDADNERLVVFGGATNTDPLALQISSEVWTFDGNTWTQQTAVGTAPSQRLYMAYAYDTSRNRLLVFGGQVGDFVSAAYNDLYALDLATMTWSRLHDGVGSAPPGRFSAMLTYDEAGDRYLVFGGHADPGVANDVWSFDPSTSTWTELSAGDQFTGAALGCLGNSREIPKEYVTEDLSAPERRSGGAMAVLGESLFVAAGESDCSDHLDDVWVFDLPSRAWTELLESRSGESCTRRGDDCPCLCL